LRDGRGSGTRSDHSLSMGREYRSARSRQCAWRWRAELARPVRGIDLTGWGYPLAELSVFRQSRRMGSPPRSAANGRPKRANERCAPRANLHTCGSAPCAYGCAGMPHQTFRRVKVGSAKTPPDRTLGPSRNRRKAASNEERFPCLYSF